MKLKQLQMKRSVKTRWNSLSDCLKRALYLRLAIDNLLTLTKYDKPGDQGLHRYKHTAEEWTILEQLDPLLTVRVYYILSLLSLMFSPFLQMFTDATKRISASNVPLLHEVIPLINILTTQLEDCVASPALHSVVRVTAARGLHVLNKYYSRTDDSIMYRIAMST